MDHDRLFKELLTTFFVEFIELFLPDLARYMARESVVFMDKEVFTDVTSAERHEVDLLAKVRVRERGEAFFLIHVENQASVEPDFERRMFTYFARLHEKHRLPVFPIVLFSFDAPRKPRPDRYIMEFPGYRVLDFHFRAIQLNQLNWRDFLRNPNPVASALMTRMNIAPADRPRVKLECLRMLATLRLDRARATLIAVFMDAYLKLTAAEAAVYNLELQAFSPKEKEAVMEWTNEWIEQGRAEGLEKGMAQGLLEGRAQERRSIAARLLRRRFGAEAASLEEMVSRLSDTQIEEFTEALLDFSNVDDATRWLRDRI